MSRAGRTIRRHFVLVAALFLATASLVLAQTATGVIRGTVQDPTGAVVIDVQVTLVDEATESKTGAKDERGRILRIPDTAVRHLPPSKPNIPGSRKW